MNPRSRVPIGITLLAFGLMAFLSLNWHSHRPKFNYHSEIWADRAGYHVYLPAWFEYGFNASAFPAGIDERTGNGFVLDSLPGKVVTRYTCGEALLRVPFYLVGKAMRPASDPDPPGFTDVDHAFVDIAAAFYASLGALLLFWVLRIRFSPRMSAWALVAAFAGTNLLFYSIGDTGMSHVYSFFLFSAWLYLLDRGRRMGYPTMGLFLLGAVAGLIVLTRPTNIIFLPISLILLTDGYREAGSVLRDLTSLRRIPLLLLGAVLPWLPQIHYWNGTFGSPLVWSYGNEGFTNVLHPALIPFWFAPYNGLLLYAPLVVVLLTFTLVVRHARPSLNAAMWSTFMAVSYVSAAWFAWTFGCGFGARNFVEYAAVFAFPLAALLSSTARDAWVSKCLVSLCCLYTLKLTFSCSNCWFGDVWDWRMFFGLFLGPIK